MSVCVQKDAGKSPSLLHIQGLSNTGAFQVLFSTEHDDRPQFISTRRPVNRRAGQVTGHALFKGGNIFRKDTTDAQIKRIERLFDRFVQLLIGDLDIRRTEWDAAKILNDKEGKILALTGIEFFESHTEIWGCSRRRSGREFWQR